MSIGTEILRIQRNVADTYAAVSKKGGTVPTQPNSENLPAAVSSIPPGGDTFLVRAPIGTIVIWSGTADNIPAGWHLCDGTEGTVDLRDRFVLGAGNKYGAKATGGNETATLSTDTFSHSGTSSYQAYTPSGSEQAVSIMPPYYALCWIQKITADPADGVTHEELTAALEGKQDTLTGTSGQVVGFDAQGKAVAQEAPSGGMTQTGADGRYLKLTGGTVTGPLSVQAPTAHEHAATKQYVDDAIGAAITDAIEGAY